MKRRVIIIGLVVFTLWPLAHRALVARFEINPWKLFGWAMYCVPNPKTSIQVYELKGDRMRRLAPEGADDVDMGTYNFRRGILGRLASPKDLVHRTFQRHPDFEGLSVVVDRYHVDWQTALLKWDREITTYLKTGNQIDLYSIEKR